jgi:hypothetical protein
VGCYPSAFMNLPHTNRPGGTVLIQATIAHSPSNNSFLLYWSVVTKYLWSRPCWATPMIDLT